MRSARVDGAPGCRPPPPGTPEQRNPGAGNSRQLGGVVVERRDQTLGHRRELLPARDHFDASLRAVVCFRWRSGCWNLARVQHNAMPTRTYELLPDLGHLPQVAAVHKVTLTPALPSGTERQCRIMSHIDSSSELTSPCHSSTFAMPCTAAPHMPPCQPFRGIDAQADTLTYRQTDTHTHTEQTQPHTGTNTHT
eukprot:1328996-Rhodomonas_salina.2